MKKDIIAIIVAVAGVALASLLLFLVSGAIWESDLPLWVKIMILA